MTYDLNITFDDNLVTGNKTIDTQHKELKNCMNTFRSMKDQQIGSVNLYRKM